MSASCNADDEQLHVSLLESKLEYLQQELEARRRCDSEAAEFARRQREQVEVGLDSLDEDGDVDGGER